GGQVVSSDGAGFSSLTYTHIEVAQANLADPGAGFRNAVYIDDLTSDFNLNTNGNTDVNIGNAGQNAAAILATHSIFLNNNSTGGDNVTLYDQASTANTNWFASAASVNAGGSGSLSISGAYTNITINGGTGANTYDVIPESGVNFFVSDAAGTGTLT